MASILFNSAEPLNKLSIPLRQKTPCESDENWASGYREEDVERFNVDARLNFRECLGEIYVYTNLSVAAAYDYK